MKFVRKKTTNSCLFQQKWPKYFLPSWVTWIITLLGGEKLSQTVSNCIKHFSFPSSMSVVGFLFCGSSFSICWDRVTCSRVPASRTYWDECLSTWSDRYTRPGYHYSCSSALSFTPENDVSLGFLGCPDAQGFQKCILFHVMKVLISLQVHFS